MSTRSASSPTERTCTSATKSSTVLSDRFGVRLDGTPFHGAIVRKLDANDPAHIQVTGEVPLAGTVTGTYVKGNTLYAFAEVQELPQLG